ncbi:MAG: hypothetical protein M3R17_07405 [Bacteroidota bacterium]|nr:hypothetical protein [Bacteroidota bacterium]
MNENFINRPGSKKIVLPFFLAGAFFLLLFTVGLFICSDEITGHYFHPHLLALVHVVILGFCTMIIFGALYQFLPVIAERPLYSAKLTVWTFVLLFFGTLLLGYAFWTFNIGYIMQIAGIIILISVSLHSINVLLTLKGAKSTITLDCISTAHFWLLLTVLIGLLLVFNFQFAFLPKDQLHYLGLHAHLGLAGWLLLLVIGVASKLIPMFMLAGSDYSKLIRISYYTINAALILFFADVILTHSYTRAWLYVIIICVGLYAFAMMVHRVHKDSMRKKTDGPMKQTFIAILFLLFPVLITLLRFLPLAIFNESELINLSRIYGIALIPGFFIMIILGQTFKTLPFILWIDLKHKQMIPNKFMPRDLYNSVAVLSMVIAWNAGILVLILGNTFELVWMNYFAAALMTLSALLYLFNILFMLRKKNLVVKE